MTRANGNALAHRYGLLAADERFRLAIEAGARGDDVERARLAASCPMQTGSWSDPAYFERVEASREMALVVALQLGPVAAQLKLLAVTGELVDHAARAVAGETVKSPLSAAFDGAAHEFRADGGAVFQAFAVVCRRQLRLEPETVLRAHLGPYVEQLGLGEFERAKPDRAAVREWRDVFETYWARRQAA